MSSYLTLEIQSSVRCDDCNVRTPLPGLRIAASCRGCAAPIDVAAIHRKNRQSGLRYLFGGYYDAPVQALEHPEQKITDCRDGHLIPVALARAEPACGCGVKVAIPTMGVRAIPCAACGDQIAVRWPDAVTRAYDPRLYCVIGDAGTVEKGRSARGGAKAPNPATTPVGGGAAVLLCGGCGAPLVPDGRRRSVACDHCHAPNFLGDAAWIALHPRPDEHRAYLVYAVTDDLKIERPDPQSAARAARAKGPREVNR